MRAPLMIVAFFSLLAACTPQETKLGVGDATGAFVEGGGLLLFGADHGGEDIEGVSFTCPEGTAQCRRLFAARYDKDFKRTALFATDLPGQELTAALQPTADGYRLLATAGSWATSEEGASDPEFDVTLIDLSPGLEERARFEIPSGDTREIHAAFLKGDTLTVAGLDDGLLFVDRYDAATGENIDRNDYDGEGGGIVVFLGGDADTTHIVRWFFETGFRYLILNTEGAVAAALTLTGDAMDPDPTAGSRGIAALLSDGSLYWFGEDSGLYRLEREGDTVTVGTSAMLDAGELTYQRDIRFVGSNLYVFGASDRVQKFEACAYGGDDTTVKTHETELVLVKFDAAFVQLWSDRDTEDATYRAIEVLTRGKERFFLYQKGATLYLRPTD